MLAGSAPCSAAGTACSACSNGVSLKQSCTDKHTEKLACQACLRTHTDQPHAASSGLTDRSTASAHQPAADRARVRKHTHHVCQASHIHLKGDAQHPGSGQHPIHSHCARPLPQSCAALALQSCRQASPADSDLLRQLHPSVSCTEAHPADSDLLSQLRPSVSLSEAPHHQLALLSCWHLEPAESWMWLLGAAWRAIARG